MQNKVAILIPIYKVNLDLFEQYSLDHSISVLLGRELFFVGPQDLALNYYSERYPNLPFIPYESVFFSSIKGYNLLLLSQGFYAQFNQFEFMLILQTDAIVLRDELTHWCDQPFDYVGAPWPDSVELFVNIGRFDGDKGRRVRAMVGNGGFSLRRIQKCISLLQEFPEAVDYFNRSGSSEDLFFSFMAPLSADFVLPNEITASHFSMELKPSFYYAINGNRLPMGGHAWWKYEPEFWLNQLPDAPFMIQK
ncbi:MAG: DUF5672 family protein [Gallionellaceae bacterium]|jgi:hypothetical protein